MEAWKILTYCLVLIDLHQEGCRRASSSQGLSGCAGPCIGLDTACSSSLVAAHLAARGLLDSETSAALAAGVNLMLVPGTFTHMAQLGALSPTGRSKSLDAAADGYGRGEGCIAVIMRRPGQAVITNDSPLAMLRGTEVPHLLLTSCIIRRILSHFGQEAES